MYIVKAIVKNKIRCFLITDQFSPINFVLSSNASTIREGRKNSRIPTRKFSYNSFLKFVKCI